MAWIELYVKVASPAWDDNANYALNDQVVGSDAKNYFCKLAQDSTKDAQPTTGADWATYWTVSDGTTAVRAWTFAEMTAANIATAATSETRVNIKSGAYSQGAWTWDAGVALFPIVYRGYNTTPGDLDQAVRGADGLLVTTNFPVVTCTAPWAPNTFTFMQNLVITGALATAIVSSATVDTYGFVNCSISNTLNDASATCVLADDYCYFINCDLSCTGAAHSYLVTAGVSVRVIGCTFKITLNTQTAVICDSGTFYQSVFIGKATVGAASKAIDTGIVAVALIPVTILGCTIYGYETAINVRNVAQTGMPILIADNIITDCTNYLVRVAGGNTIVIESNQRTRDNTNPRSATIISATLGREVTTDTGGAESDYVSVTTGNLQLIPSSPARIAGMMPKSDCGAFQSNLSRTRSRPLRASSKSS